MVTDISSSRLNGANEYAYHKNNAMFLVPTSGPNKGIGFRFAYTSWWPEGNRTMDDNPSTPKPATVAITRR